MIPSPEQASDAASVVETDIAIIGMAGRFPGADSVEAFWRNVAQGVESIGVLPDDELLRLGVDPALLRHPRYVKAGGTLENIEYFDADFFGVKPAEALMMDPQHRVFLECAWEALEHAGYAPDRCPGAVGVYAGSNASPYLAKVRAHHELFSTFGDFYALIGNDKDYLATRVSYKLDLRGPSLAVQTACSTSLVAIHLACQGVLNGECDMALAGGVGISAKKVTGYLYEEGGIHSSDGHCRPFDARAEGTVSGSGAGIVVLKQLSRALADGDCVHAVIKGSAINNDGRRKVSFTAPGVAGQAAAIAEALAASGVDADTIGYVETHGTGTPLGDPIEVAALTQAFGAGSTGTRPRSCALGSAKSNIGHLTAAAGVAGLIRAACALQQRLIPPSPYFETPNPQIDFASGPFFVNPAPVDWQAGTAPRRALVSSFGIGGTNAHVVLEEPPAQPAPAPDRGAHLLVLSARTPSALDRMTQRLAEALDTRGPVHDCALADAAYTLATGRSPFAHRRLIACDAATPVAAAAADPARVSTAIAPAGAPPVAFLFPGGGAQTVRMGEQLYAEQPLFRAEVDRCLSLLRASTGLDLRPVLYPPAGAGPQDDDALNAAGLAHPALFIIEYALAAFLIKLGVRPSVVIGHSMGEFAAATIAGVFTLDAALQLVTARGRLMERVPRGTMLIVPLPEQEMRAMLTPDIALAAINAPTSCVVSGDTAAVLALEAHLLGRGIECRQLRFSHASHSPMMDPILDDFAEAVRQANPQPPAIPLISNVTGQRIAPEAIADPQYWARHLRGTVRFSEGLRDALQDPATVLIEVGPGRTLAKLARRQGPQFADRFVLPTLRVDEPAEAIEPLLRTVGECWLRGVAVDWDACYAGQARRRVRLPTYPFERQPFWIDDQPHAAATTAAAADTIVRPAAAHAREDARGDAMSDTVRLAASPASPAAPASSASSVAPAVAPLAASSAVPSSASSASSSGSRSDRIASLSVRLTGIVARLFGYKAEEISATATLLELGADSLLLMRASRAIEDEIGIAIPFRRLMTDLASVTALAQFLDAQLPPEPAVDAAPAAVPMAAAAAPAIAAQAGQPVPTAATTPALAALPLPAAAVPDAAMSAAIAAAASVRERVILEQLRLMSRQLELLPSEMPALASVPAAAIAATTPLPAAPAMSPAPVSASASALAPAPAPTSTSAAPSAAPPPATAGTTGTASVEPQAFGPYRPLSGGRAPSMTMEQQAHLDRLIAAHCARTAGSKQFAAHHRTALADPRAPAGFQLAWKDMIYPIVGQRSEGARMWDVDGNEYIDFTMGFGVHLFGHSPSFVMEALARQLADGIHIGPQSSRAGRVAALIAEATGMERVAFCNSGTEAMMAAVRLARATTGRPAIVMFTGSYHGTFDGVLARARAGGQGEAVPVAPGTPQNLLADVIVLEYGDAAALDAIAAQASRIAAVLVEPVQSRKLDLQPQAFLRDLRTITARHGVALIFDEIITGFRVHPSGAQGWFGVKADLAAYGKVVGAGLPIGILAGSAQYLDAVDGGFWQYGDASIPTVTQVVFAGTFSKNPLAMAAAEAVLDRLKQAGPRLQEDLNARTSRLARALAALFAEEQVPMQVVHFGSMFRFSREPSARSLDLLFYHLLARGFYIWEGRGCFLSTAHTDADVDRFIDAVRASIGDLRDGGFLPPSPRPRRELGESPREFDAVAAAADEEALADACTLVPLTSPMRQLWVHTRFNRETALAYQELLAVRMDGPLDRAAFDAALSRLVERHEALRATCDADGGFLRIAARLPVSVDYVDAASTSAASATTAAADAGETQHGDETAARALIAREADEPLDHVRGPLFRARLYAQGSDRHLFVFVFHHLIMDGFSVDIFMRELARLYGAAAHGTACDLPPAPRLSDYMQTRLAAERTEAAARARTYWLAQLEGASPLRVPADSEAIEARGTQADGGRARLLLPPDLQDGVKTLASQFRCTAFTVLLAAFGALLHRWSGQSDLTIGVPLLRRAFDGDEQLIGHCVDLQPVRSRIADDETMGGYLRRMAAQRIAAIEHDQVGYSDIVTALKPASGDARSPLIAATFNLDPPASAVDGDIRWGALALTQVSSAVRHVKFDLHLNIASGADGLHVSCDYNARACSEASVQALLQRYELLIRALMRDASQPIARVPLLTADERQRLLVDWNATARRDADTRACHELIAEHARRTPEHAAVADRTALLTYGELMARAGQVAARLRAMGVEAESRVAICVERGVDMVAGMLGIMQAGAAYLPLDPTHPAARLAFMVADAQAAVVLTHDHLRSIFADSRAPIVTFDELRAQTPPQEPARDASPALPEQAAYVIYTSGSTGMPKGVTVTHRGLSNLVRWHNDAYRLTPADRTSQVANMSFDACTWEIWPTLAAGGTLHIAEPTLATSAPDLVRWLDRQGITVTFLPTPIAQAALQEPWPATAALRLLLTGGDRLRRVADLPRPFAVINHYGPTENAVVATAHTLTDVADLPPIGGPIGNVEAYVLDAGGELVPIGAAGELYIGGESLARGYAGRAALTADRFVPDGCSGRSGARLYRTGDLVRWRRDGALDYIGRADSQVKVHGVRIELGEVEAALAACAGVANAAATVVEPAPGESRLVAYLVGRAGTALDPHEIRQELRRTLPAAMVPGQFVLLDRLPLTAHGKIDRTALPAPPPPTRAAQPAEDEAPAETAEGRRMADIWARLFGLGRVGTHDDFFDLGGDSLRAMRLIGHVREELGVELDIATIFEHTTPETLAAAMAAGVPLAAR